MRRGLAVVLVVALVGLGLLAVADRVVHTQAEARATASLATAGIDLSDDAQITLGGFPFLTQLLRGTLTEASLEAGGATIEGMDLVDVEATAEGITTAAPYTATSLELSATAPTATLTQAVAASQLGDLGFDVEIGIEDDAVVASTTVLGGLPARVTMVPVPAGRAIGLGLESVSVAGFTVSAEDLPRVLRDALARIQVPLEELPEGLEVTDVVVVADGLRITASGTDVVLEAPATSPTESDSASAGSGGAGSSGADSASR